MLYISLVDVRFKIAVLYGNGALGRDFEQCPSGMVAQDDDDSWRERHTKIDVDLMIVKENEGDRQLLMGNGIL